MRRRDELLGLAAASVVLLIGLLGCTLTFDASGKSFRCEKNGDCASGFECSNPIPPDGIRVCVASANLTGVDTTASADTADTAIAEDQQIADLTPPKDQQGEDQPGPDLAIDQPGPDLAPTDTGGEDLAPPEDLVGPPDETSPPDVTTVDSITSDQVVPPVDADTPDGSTGCAPSSQFACTFSCPTNDTEITAQILEGGWFAKSMMHNPTMSNSDQGVCSGLYTTFTDAHLTFGPDETGAVAFIGGALNFGYCVNVKNQQESAGSQLDLAISQLLKINDRWSIKTDTGLSLAIECLSVSGSGNDATLTITIKLSEIPGLQTNIVGFPKTLLTFTFSRK